MLNNMVTDCDCIHFVADDNAYSLWAVKFGLNLFHFNKIVALRNMMKDVVSVRKVVFSTQTLWWSLLPCLFHWCTREGRFNPPVCSLTTFWVWHLYSQPGFSVLVLPQHSWKWTLKTLPKVWSVSFLLAIILLSVVQHGGTVIYQLSEDNRWESLLNHVWAVVMILHRAWRSCWELQGWLLFTWAPLCHQFWWLCPAQDMPKNLADRG